MQDHFEEYNIDLSCIRKASWSLPVEHLGSVVVGCIHQVVLVEVEAAKAAKAAAVGLAVVEAGWVARAVTVGWVAAMEG